MFEEPEVKNELNPNAPELNNKNPERQPYVKAGFHDKTDYECFKRRMSDRKKAAKNMTSGY